MGQPSPPYGQPAGGQPASPPYGQPGVGQAPGGQAAQAPVQQPPQIIPARTASPSPSLTFSHEGPRYILGYSSEYFGLWDKAAPGPPVQKFPRTEQGWQQAWEALVRAEMTAGGR
jgi:hypothetical protein